MMYVSLSGVVIFTILLGLSTTIRLPHADPGVPLPQEELFTDLHQRFERQLDATLEQKEILSSEAIAAVLNRLAILHDSDIEVSDIRLLVPPRFSRKKFQPIFLPEQLLREAIHLAKKNGQVKSGTELILARSNFDIIGLKMPERMHYDSVSRSLFIHYEKPFERRITFSRRMFLTALEAEYEWQSRVVSGKQRAVIKREFTEGVYRPKSLSAISYGALKRHSTVILRDFSRYRADKRVSELIAHASIPYGTFFWFYENRLGKAGYEGPSAAELLAMAFKAREMRKSENPAYALIGQYAKGEDSVAIVSEFDIFSRPDERLQNGSSEERLRYWKHRAFFFFLREYLGKIYNGIYGNTPDTIELRIRLDLGSLGLPSKERRFDVLFHEPYSEERVCFSKMKWHGRSIVEQ
ncbi:MAG: hypothetical protein Q7R79_04125 [bacterium]|nr:hypothetical protein [bacterium]